MRLFSRSHGCMLLHSTPRTDRDRPADRGRPGDRLRPPWATSFASARHAGPRTAERTSARRAARSGVPLACYIDCRAAQQAPLSPRARAKAARVPRAERCGPRARRSPLDGPLVARATCARPSVTRTREGERDANWTAPRIGPGRGRRADAVCVSRASARAEDGRVYIIPPVRRSRFESVAGRAAR